LRKDGAVETPLVAVEMGNSAGSQVFAAIDAAPLPNTYIVKRSAKSDFTVDVEVIEAGGLGRTFLLARGTMQPGMPPRFTFNCPITSTRWTWTADDKLKSTAALGSVCRCASKIEGKGGVTSWQREQDAGSQTRLVDRLVSGRAVVPMSFSTACFTKKATSDSGPRFEHVVLSGSFDSPKAAASFAPTDLLASIRVSKFRAKTMEEVVDGHVGGIAKESELRTSAAVATAMEDERALVIALAIFPMCRFQDSFAAVGGELEEEEEEELETVPSSSKKSCESEKTAPVSVE